jgi:Rod binding domain-containing protein
MDARLFSACQEFEAFMLRPLFSAMKIAHPLPSEDADGSGDDAVGARGSDDLLQSLYVETLSTAFARAGGVGFAAELARSLGERPA